MPALSVIPQPQSLHIKLGNLDRAEFKFASAPELGCPGAAARAFRREIFANEFELACWTPARSLNGFDDEFSASSDSALNYRVIGEFERVAHDSAERADAQADEVDA